MRDDKAEQRANEIREFRLRNGWQRELTLELSGVAVRLERLVWPTLGRAAE